MEREIVSSREELAQYVKALQEDLVANSGNWENVTLKFYFEALATYIQNVHKFYEHNHIQIDAEQPSWGCFGWCSYL
ncbi:DUF7660 family protein [Anabaena azotica]|uniref:DUF7660 domain-containing protein n=1 Tax=Anabaena azotica FACHB-119 TaxID=947527 RepID=A0ABR8D1P3_9NOST|nr:hypothetical protein [Anabaena azotica]MBD2501047.1 hypothetical protein [Anabaena azotica FACHB-119]